jgi:hypothetical protein
VTITATPAQAIYLAFAVLAVGAGIFTRRRWGARALLLGWAAVTSLVLFLYTVVAASRLEVRALDNGWMMFPLWPPIAVFIIAFFLQIASRYRLPILLQWPLGALGLYVLMQLVRSIA